MSDPLSPESIDTALKTLPGWSHAGDKLQKTYLFNTFPEALSFMVRIGFAAESQNHHPEMFNVYNRVAISLNTHDAGGKVTQKDLRLAAEIEVIHEAFPLKA